MNMALPLLRCLLKIPQYINRGTISSRKLRQLLYAKKEILLVSNMVTGIYDTMPGQADFCSILTIPKGDSNVSAIL